jgi:hypothetical protein
MGRRMWGLGLVAVVAAITTIIACRQLVGITDNPPTDLTSTLCGLPYGTSVCASCVNTNCCAESTACAADPVCSAYESCLGVCNGDPACRSQCTIDHPVGGAADVSALSSCVAGKCETACGLECGGIANLRSTPDAAAGCQDCYLSSTTTCSQAEACGSSEACDESERCVFEFSGFDTLQACNGTADGGAGLAGAFDTAFNTACETPCAVGNYWACAGRVSWSPPKAAMTTFGFTVKDFTTGLPVSGVDVAVCGGIDVNCSKPYASQQTNTTGQVQLTFQNVLGSNSSFGLNGYLQISSPSIAPYIYYWGFPLSEMQLNLYTEVFTASELQQALSNVKVTQDVTRGYVTAIVFDCLVNAAPGVVVKLSSADALTQEFSSTGVAETATDTVGQAIFTNVPVGPMTLTASPPGLGKPSSTVTANVRVGTITQVLMVPTPTSP